MFLLYIAAHSPPYTHADHPAICNSISYFWRRAGICDSSHFILSGHQFDPSAVRVSQWSTTMTVFEVLLQDTFENILLLISLFVSTLLCSSSISCLNILCTSILPPIQLSRSTKQSIFIELPLHARNRDVAIFHQVSMHVDWLHSRVSLLVILTCHLMMSRSFRFLT